MAPATRDASRIWILLIALLSGAVCLIYQLVWSRYLQLILGISAYSVAMVLTCFMLGLALGAWILGRWIDRSRSPRLGLIVIEVILANYILISPGLYHAVSGIESRAIQVIAAIGTLLIPTFLMGGTFPAFMRLVSRDLERIGVDAGLIYAVNTIGGAIGAFVTGFFLIGGIGLRRTLLLASVLSFVIVALVAIGIRQKPEPEQTTTKKKPKPNPPAPSGSFATVAIVFATCGFTGLAYEVFWTRLLSLFFKDSIYDLTIVLTTYLTGLALGSMVCAAILKRVKRPGDLLAMLSMLIGLSALGGLFLIERFPYWINHLQTNSAMVERYGDRFWLAGNMIRFGYALLLMFVPTFLFGAVLPVVSRMGVDQPQKVGSRIGLLSGINTLGSALGALVAGFVLIEWVGLANGIILMGFLNVLAAMLVIRSWLARGIAFVVAFMLAALSPPWDRLRMSFSFLDPSQNGLESLIAQEFYREDVHGITAVVNLKPLQRKYLVTNRLFTENSSVMGGAEDHRRLGHIPMLLHPAPKKALAIGLGAGITLRGMVDHLVDAIDCVELSPAVVEAARHFPDENARVLENPKVRLIVDDARHFMRTTRHQYDVIVLDIFHPMSGGSSMIFSREYYQFTRQHLAPGGLLCQWLPAHQLSEDEIATITKTMQAVFPHVSLWYGLIGSSTAVIGLVATEEPLAIDFPRLAGVVQAHPELREIELGRPEQLLSQFVMADGSLSEFYGGEPIDTDDRPVVELGAPRLVRRAAHQGAITLMLLSMNMKDVRPYITNLPDSGSLSAEIDVMKERMKMLEVPREESYPWGAGRF